MRMDLPLMFALALAEACLGPAFVRSGSDKGSDADTDTDVDTDADADGDTDTDADADGDTDTDADADADADKDQDGDGITVGEGDCDDENADIHPDASEVCGNDTDDDCDSGTPDVCDVDHSDDWSLDSPISYQCASSAVDIEFSGIHITEAAPDISIDTSSHPGTLTGSFTTDVDFYAVNSYSGACTEDFEMTGTFTSATNMEGKFSASFSGSCYDCETQNWTFTARR